MSLSPLNAEVIPFEKSWNKSKLFTATSKSGLSVVSIAELVHGAYRTKTHTQRERRLEFIERLSTDVPVHPVTIDIARLAGRIEGEQEAKGLQFAFEDLLIGATALHLGFEVATLNVRDFQKIPALSLTQL